MKSIISAFIITCAFGFEAVGQDMQVEWTKPFYNWKDSGIMLVGSDSASKSIYYLSQIGDQYRLLKFNSENERVMDNPVDLSALQKDASGQLVIEQAIRFADQVTLVISLKDKGQSHTKVILQDMSLEGHLKPEPKSLFEVKEGDDSDIMWAWSKNLSYVTAALTLRSKKGQEHRLSIKTVDRKLNEISSREVVVPGLSQSKRSYIDKIITDNKGDIYVLASYATLVKGYFIFVPKIFALHPSSKELIPITFDFRGIKFAKYDLSVNGAGEIILKGFFENPGEKKHLYAGYFYGSIDTESNSIDLKLSPISPNIQHPPIRTDVFAPQWEVIPKDDGGEFWMVEYVWVASNNPHFGNILVLNLDGHGSIMYSTSIAKSQLKYLGTFRNKGFVSYYSYLASYDNATDRLSLIFNDSQKNLDVTNQGPASSLMAIANRVLVSVEIGPDGQISKSEVKTNDGGVIFCTGYSLQFKDNKAVVFGLKEDQVFFGNLARRP